MRKTLRTMPCALAAAALGVTLISACGSSSHSGAASGNTASAQVTAPDSAGVAAAKAYLAPFEQNPTHIDVDVPLPSKPAPGKTVVFLSTSSPVDELESAAFTEAAKVLGWTPKVFLVGNGPEDPLHAFQSALELSPAPFAIGVEGFAKQTFASALAEAQRRGIYVVSAATTDPIGDGITTLVNPPAADARQGELIAALTVVQSNGTANAALFTLPSYLEQQITDNGFLDGMKKWCPACIAKIEPEEAAGIGTTIPSSVVSTFQSNPKLNYAAFTFSDLAIGVPAALEAAGLTSRVNLIGALPDPVNIQAMKSGSNQAWIGISGPSTGWEVVDAMARIATGASLAPVATNWAPAQVITKDNVGTVIFDSNDNYLGIRDVAAQYEKLWHVN